MVVDRVVEVVVVVAAVVVVVHTFDRLESTFAAFEVDKQPFDCKILHRDWPLMKKRMLMWTLWEGVVVVVEIFDGEWKCYIVVVAVDFVDGCWLMRMDDHLKMNRDVEVHRVKVEEHLYVAVCIRCHRYSYRSSLLGYQNVIPRHRTRVEPDYDFASVCY